MVYNSSDCLSSWKCSEHWCVFLSRKMVLKQVGNDCVQAQCLPATVTPAKVFTINWWCLPGIRCRTRTGTSNFFSPWTFFSLCRISFPAIEICIFADNSHSWDCISPLGVWETEKKLQYWAYLAVGKWRDAENQATVTDRVRKVQVVTDIAVWPGKQSSQNKATDFMLHISV